MFKQVKWQTEKLILSLASDFMFLVIILYPLVPQMEMKLRSGPETFYLERQTQDRGLKRINMTE